MSRDSNLLLPAQFILTLIGTRGVRVIYTSEFRVCRLIINRRQTSESDVCRRQILTSKVDPRTERIKNYNGSRYSNEAERSTMKFMMISKLKKTLLFWFM